MTWAGTPRSVRVWQCPGVWIVQRERVGARCCAVGHPTEYIGLDWRPGPGVDVVGLVHEYQPGRLFDTVISTEMLGA